jgi:PAS domain S-box-containing protein
LVILTDRDTRRHGAAEAAINLRHVESASFREAGLRTIMSAEDLEFRDGRDRQRLVVKGVPSYAIFSTDPQGMVSTWNLGAEGIFGYTQAEVVGQDVGIIFTPEDRQAGMAEAEMRGAEAEGRATDRRWHVKKDGRRFWADGVVIPLQDDSGQPRGYLKILRDMTEQRDLEEALRSRTAELERADESRNEFLAMLAHELRNPLAAVRNAVTVVNRSGTREDIDWAMTVIDRQVRNFAHLIDDLLDVARITQGKIRLKKQFLDAAPIVHHAAEAVRPLMEERGHEFRVVFGSTGLVVEADPTRLEEILVNLLSNAAKYTPVGGHIQLTAGVEDGQVVFVVKDDGVGIAPELLPRVFDLFAQGDRSLARAEGGLGIGLTVVRALAELHGGLASARSEGVGRGSEFIVRLPVAKPPETPRAAPVAVAPIAERPSRILVVDDNVDTAIGLSRLLRRSGFDPRPVHSGDQAIDEARKFRPEVVLLDIGLPGMDGFQVATALRREEHGREALLIAISGYSDDETQRRAKEAQFDHVLVKPIDYDALTNLLTSPR